MQILGTDNGSGSRRTYIVSITHEELEKAADQYYGKLEPLKVGTEFNLGRGYEFKAAITEQCKKMQETYALFQRSSSLLQEFASMVIEHDKVEDDNTK